MEENQTQNGNNLILAEVLVSDDRMTGYIKLTKQDELPEPITREQLMDALKGHNIVYGIKDSALEKLAMRPIFNIKIEVAKGLPPVDGEDGSVIYHVKKDSEYKPNYSLEGNIDYKNLDYFQLVKKDDLLCEIIKEKEGTDGINIYGAAVPAKKGKPPIAPIGKNTQLIEDDTKLISTCDGVVRFVRDIIDINDMMKINSDVDQLTGNIRFTGDVTIEGDVCDGFLVKSEGNIIVKGVVEDATIEAAGNVHISKGINGGGVSTIFIGGDLRCKYIENATIHVNGNISADYIIDSKVTCMGNIELAGTRELVLGGEVKVLGKLKARDIGSEKERITKIEILGTEVHDSANINKLKAEIEECNGNTQKLMETANKLGQVYRLNGSHEIMEQLTLVKRQLQTLKDLIDHKTSQLRQLEQDYTIEYHGSVTCKRKMYQGVKVHFGDTRFHFDLDNIEHCRIYWDNGEIIHGML